MASLLKCCISLYFLYSCLMVVTCCDYAPKKDDVDKCNRCPYQSVNVTVEERESIFSDLVKQVWQLKIPLTNLGKKFKNTILKMNSMSDMNRLAHIISIYFVKYIPFLHQKPAACYLAELINATIYCKENQDDTPMQKALGEYYFSYTYINNLARMQGDYAAGCDFRCGKSPPDPEVYREYCYKNGFSYDIDNVWNSDGINRFPELKPTVMQMYKSNNHVDNFLAVLSTVSLTPSFSRMFAKWDWNLQIEGVKLQLTRPIDKVCCFSRFNIGIDVKVKNDMEALQKVENEKNYLSVTKCQ